MKVGRKIRALRKSLNLDQGAFGERLGVSRSAISSWETDLFPVPYGRLLTICDAFNKPVDDFLTKAERRDYESERISTKGERVPRKKNRTA